MRFCANCARPKEYFDEKYCLKCQKELGIQHKSWSKTDSPRRLKEKEEMIERLKYIIENDKAIQAALGNKNG